MLAIASMWHSVGYMEKKHIENQSSALQCASCFFPNSYKLFARLLSGLILCSLLLYLYYRERMFFVEKNPGSIPSSSVPLSSHLIFEYFLMTCGSALVALRIWVQHFRSMRIRIPGIWWQKIVKCFSWKNITIFWSNCTIFNSLGLHKEPPSYMRSLHHLKENVKNFKTKHFFALFFFDGHLSHPEPDLHSQCGWSGFATKLLRHVQTRRS